MSQGAPFHLSCQSLALIFHFMLRVTNPFVEGDAIPGVI